MPRYLAHTPEDGQTTTHPTARAAMKAANERTGRIDDSQWTRIAMEEKLVVWEKQARNDRDLYALVLPEGQGAAAFVAECYGMLLEAD